MQDQFGVIVVDKTHVVFEGNSSELFDMLKVVKNNISENAEVKILDKDEYDYSKGNIDKLTKLIDRG